MVPRAKRDIFYSRTTALTVFLFLFMGLLVTRLFVLQVVQGKDFKAQAEDQHSFSKKILPTRGDIKIFDKQSGESSAVATNEKKSLVYAVPGEITEPLKTATLLGDILAMEKEELLTKFEFKDRKYVPLKKQLTEAEETKIKELKLLGIYFDTEEVRVYPEKRLLSQTLGFVGYKEDKRAGLYGLEKYFEKDLAGKQGLLVQEKDLSGAWIFGSKRDYTPPVDGTSILLTIDKSIQFKAENVLKDTVTKHEAESGSVVIVNPKTGAILALANYPDYDPNEYGKVEDPKLFLNQAATGSYEPGSVFKPLTMAAAINEGKVSAETTFVDTGSVEIDNYTIKNSDEMAHGTVTMTQVLEQSLNTGMIFAKEQIGNETFYDYIKKFGFGSLTNVELSESKGNLDNLKANIRVNFHTASFGQGISVTPLQLVQAFTAIANGGKMIQPHLVQSKLFPDGSTEQVKPKEVKQVISPKTANIVSAMMVNVVENGHGKKAAVPGYYIAGKTGTAQVPKKDGRGYELNKNIGSFVGFGPVDNPQFLMLVRIDYPKTVKFAESTAAPAFGELASFILKYYNVPPSRQ
jgi:stage V sporulation protein D (sporulation-specific penicillin-binding protein)